MASLGKIQFIVTFFDELNGVGDGFVRLSYQFSPKYPPVDLCGLIWLVSYPVYHYRVTGASSAWGRRSLIKLQLD